MANITVGLFTKQTGWNVHEVNVEPEKAFKLMESLWEERNSLRTQLAFAEGQIEGMKHATKIKEELQREGDMFDTGGRYGQ